MSEIHGKDIFITRFMVVAELPIADMESSHSRNYDDCTWSTAVINRVISRIGDGEFKVSSLQV